MGAKCSSTPTIEKISKIAHDPSPHVFTTFYGHKLGIYFEHPKNPKITELALSLFNCENCAFFITMLHNLSGKNGQVLLPPQCLQPLRKILPKNIFDIYTKISNIAKSACELPPTSVHVANFDKRFLFDIDPEHDIMILPKKIKSDHIHWHSHISNDVLSHISREDLYVYWDELSKSVGHYAPMMRLINFFSKLEPTHVSNTLDLIAEADEGCKSSITWLKNVLDSLTVNKIIWKKLKAIDQCIFMIQHLVKCEIDGSSYLIQYQHVRHPILRIFMIACTYSLDILKSDEDPESFWSYYEYATYSDPPGGARPPYSVKSTIEQIKYIMMQIEH